MKKNSEFKIDASTLNKVVRKAVDEQYMSLSEIAFRAGLSVPTIARLYSESVEFVQAKTARRVAQALGYETEISPTGSIHLNQAAERNPDGKLTETQKVKLRRAFDRLLDEL